MKINNLSKFTLFLSCSFGAFASNRLTNLSLFERAHSALNSALPGIEFDYLSKDERIDSLKQLREVIRKDYALIEIKKLNANIDIEAIFEEALATEELKQDPTEILDQAKSNIEFYDRINLILTKIQDTHFDVGALNPLAPVTLGIRFMEIAGAKVVVSGTAPKIMGLNDVETESKEFSSIKFGDELISVDGKPVAEHMAALLPYVGGASSVGFARMLAAAGIGIRNYLYPEKAYADLEIKTQAGETKKLRFPWFYNKLTRSDQAYLAQARGYKSYKGALLTWDKDANEWKGVSEIEFPRYRMATSTKGLIEVKEYFDVESNDTGMIFRTGYKINQAKVYGVLQIFGFHAMNVKIKGTGQPAIPFIKVIQEYVKSLKTDKIPLIIDLRSNGGGYGQFPRMLLSALLAADQKASAETRSFRVNRYTSKLFDLWGAQSTTAEVLDGMSSETFVNLFKSAKSQAQSHSDAYAAEVKADDVIGGFDSKIVTLISPTCISACDITSMLLKGSGRAKLIGISANGTGAGYYSDGPLNTEWRDSNHNLVSQIPNFLFGTPVLDRPANGILPGKAVETNSENRPALADVTYETTLRDILEGDAGWYEKAIEVLNQP